MLTIANHTFSSRLFTGTGKFARPDLMAAAIAASGSQLVTMAIKRLEPGKRHDDILSPLLKLGVKLLPNTSGAKTAAEAVFAAHLAAGMVIVTVMLTHLCTDVCIRDIWRFAGITGGLS